MLSLTVCRFDPDRCCLFKAPLEGRSKTVPVPQSFVEILGVILSRDG